MNDMDFITELNFNAAYGGQEHLCARCKKNMESDLKRGRVFYWLNSSHNECYCEACGLQIQKEIDNDD